jgi:CHAT domain-containing protein/Tfp pilus assembly protein PilF
MIFQSDLYSVSKECNRQVIYQNLGAFFPLFLAFCLLTFVPSDEVFGYASDPFRQSTQERPGAGTGAGGENDVRSLEPGKPYRRELAGGQRHTYRIRLAVDQFLKAVIEQDGIDVVARLLGADGEQIMEFDSERRLRGREMIEQVAEAGGDYRLVVEPKQKGAQAGGYEIRVEELRAATENDRALKEARKLYKKATDLRNSGKYNEALPHFERALEIRERGLGPDHRDVSEAINGLGILHAQKGEYSKAEPLFQRALAIREISLGPEHPDVATSLNSLANLYRFQGDYAKAEPLYQRSLAILEKSLGPEHLDVAASLNNLAILYSNLGEYVKAEPLYQRALAILEKSLGPEHPNVATSLHNLAIVYWRLGGYAKAEPLYQRSLAIREKSLGPEHPDVAISLNNLAVLYWNLGDYAKAEPLHQRSLAILEKSLGPEHPDVAGSLSNLANLYKDLGDYAKEEPLYKRALAIREKSLGPEHLDVAASLNNLAILYSDLGDYAKAEPLYQRALAIKEKSLGPEHPSVASSLNNLAILYTDLGDYAKAEPLQQRALAIREKSLGQEHPDVAISLDSLIRLHMAKNDIAQAIAFQSRANAIIERNLNPNLAICSERQKLAHLATLSKQTDRTLSLHILYAPRDPVARSLAATLILQRKGRALDATSESLNALRSRFNQEDRALLDRLTDARSQIARLVLDGPQRMNAEQYRDRVKTLEEQAEKFEAEISRRSDEFRAQSLPVTLEAVQAAIPDAAALIEFASYRPFNPKAAKDDEVYGQPRYVAYVLRRQGEIQWKELGEAKAIDEAVARLRKALRNPNRADVRRLARAVDDKIMRPVRALLGAMPGGTRRLLIAPDGSLNLIPFAALVDERGQYLVERYTISFLTGGRDLLRLQLAPRGGNAPLVVANPAFGRIELPDARTVQDSGDSQSGDQVWGRIDPDMVFFQPLPGSEREALAIKALLTEASVLLREQAAETALKRAKAPRVLHIATHGFFLGDQEPPPAGTRSPLSDNPLRLPTLLKKWAAKIENPLLRSGLALAGANERRGGDDDGVLTAMEVASLDLWGTRLVALSACDTGVGEVRNGEGVYGLRRALVLAGSETQVLSLWPVSDKETRNLMAGYYGRLLKGEGRGEALRQMQLGMLKDAKLRHPYYWASFIQAGEWANLDGRR